MKRWGTDRMILRNDYGSRFKVDEIVKIRETSFFVIPAKAEIQSFQPNKEELDSGFRRNDKIEVFKCRSNNREPWNFEPEPLRSF